MTCLIERTLRRLDGQLPGRISKPGDNRYIDILPQRRSGQSPSAGCPALSCTAGHRKMCSRRFEPRATVISRCRCAAVATTGPVAPCATGSSST